MDPIRPTSPVRGVFHEWVERRRRHLAAQRAALDEERWEDLRELLGDENEEDPPHDPSPEDRESAQALLRESEEITRRLVEVRGRVLEELGGDAPRRPDVGRDTTPHRRGDRLDGYL